MRVVSIKPPFQNGNALLNESQSDCSNAPPIRQIWIVTDVPYWERNNGSHQRIGQLCQALADRDCQLTLWWVGEALSEQSVEQITKGGVAQIAGPSTPPSGWAKRSAWHLACTLSAAKTRLNSSAVKHTSANSRSLTLAEFRVDELANRFVSDVRAAKPDAVLIEYVSLGYLAESLRSAMDVCPLLVVDTHDVMHQRCRRFEEAGLDHWLKVTEEEEAVALNSFDSIVAIQHDEAATFRRMVPNRQVVVCGLAVDSIPPNRDIGEESAAELGFLSGAGAQNLQALETFLRDAWPKVLAGCDRRPTLRIAGQICQHFANDASLPDQVVLDGPVESLSDWYQSISIVINPVAVGTGLKVKSIEALAHGRCLVSTAAGLEGIQGLPRNAAVQVSSLEEMATALRELCTDASRRGEIGQNARRFVRECLHPDRVYGELIRTLSTSRKEV